MSLIQNICMSTIILSITYLSTLNLCELESIEAAAGGIAPWRPDCRLHWLDSPTAALQHIFIVCCVSARLLQHGALLAARGVCSLGAIRLCLATLVNLLTKLP